MQLRQYLFTHVLGRSGSVSRSVLIFGFFLPTIMINILSLSVPIVILQIYDRIIPNNAYQTLKILLLGALVAVVFEAIFKILRNRISLWQAARFEYNEYCSLFKQLLEAPINKIIARSPGELINEFNLVKMKKDLFGGGKLFITLVDIPFVLVYLLLIYMIGGRLVLIPLFIMAFLVAVILLHRDRGAELINQKNQLEDRRFNFISELFTGLHTIKTHSMEPLMLRRYERLQETHGDLIFTSLTNSFELTELFQFMNQLMIVMMVSFGAIGVINHNMTLGIVAACTILSSRSIQPVAKLIAGWDKLQKLLDESEKYKSISRMPKQIDLDNKQIVHMKGAISFENVSVGTGKHCLLDNINWSVKAGEVVSITGPGLSGKTTLLHLISGEAEPTSGKVLIDNKVLRETPAATQRITYISPNTTLFQGSILDNLNGFDGINKIEKVNKLLSQFNLNSFVQKLPKGLHTQLTNQSVELIPKGVKQRLILARTMLQNPRIILFDEANINLDREADEVITSFMESLKEHVTVIFVSHRPSIQKMATKAYKIANKKLVSIYE